MNSRQDILDMICTDAIEGSSPSIGDESYGSSYVPQNSPQKNRRNSPPSENPSPMIYNLRLVRETDGTLTWRDD